MGARYGRPAVALHWLMAVLLAGSFAVGSFMTTLPLSPRRLLLTGWHKWAGIALLALAAVRLLWRLAHRPPPALPAPAWQRSLAGATHGAMYALFLAVPLLGWLYSSASGFPVVLFGVLPLPDLVGPDRDLALALKPWHARAAWSLAALAVLHVAAALWHHAVRRDAVLSRMGWGRP